MLKIFIAPISLKTFHMFEAWLWRSHLVEYFRTILNQSNSLWPWSCNQQNSSQNLGPIFHSLKKNSRIWFLVTLALLSTNSRVGIWTHNFHLLALLLYLYQPPQFHAPILCIIPSFDGTCLSYFSTISEGYVVCTNVAPLLSSSLVINLIVNILPRWPHYYPGRLSILKP